MKQESHIADVSDAGKRLDVFLSGKYKDLSRSWLQKIIKMGNVEVNGEKAHARTLLKGGDKVSIELIQSPQISLHPEEIYPEPKILFENSDFLIVDKPAGIVVHPSGSTPKGTLVNWLLYKYPSVSKIGEDPLRPGIVHRLDKETSGLMIVALNEKAFKFFKESFKERKIFKIYTALVKGVMNESEGSITNPITRDAKNPFKRKTLDVTYPLPEEVRDAETYWRKVKEYGDYSYIEVVPKTGRMHQIRVHLVSKGHPIVGDSLYNGPQLEGLSRMFLHASRLTFEGPDGKDYDFSSLLPNELSECLEKLED